MLSELITVPLQVIAPGRVRPEQMTQEVPWGALVIEGFAAAKTFIGGRSIAELIGRGDLIRPWETFDAPFGVQRSWHALTPVKLAVLDQAFEQVITKLPNVARQLIKRLAQRSTATSIHMASNRLRDLESRIAHVLWQIGHRWGEPIDDSCVIPVPLKHDLIASLIGAERPPTSLALNRLQSRGALSRNGSGLWVICRPAEAMPNE